MNTLATLTRTIANKRQTGAAAGVSLIASPGAGKRIFLHKIIFGSVSATMDVQITNGADAAGTRILDQTFAAGGGIVLDLDGSDGKGFPLTAATALLLTTDTGNCRVNVHYTVA